VDRNVAALVVLLSGAVLIVVGLVLVVLQFFGDTSAAAPMTRELSVSAESAALKTNYVGVVLVGIGAALEVFGLWATGAREQPPVR
jgi:hypothetical protein